MLKIINLTCGYGAKIVLYDISFDIDKGEFLGIIGPNGSGKTTLLRVLSRAIVPMKGEIFVDGKNIRTRPLKELAKDIAVVSQNPPLSHMSVEEFVLLGRIPYYQGFQFFETKKDMELAGRSMDLTGIFKLKDRLLNQLSGGEKQLVLIARALAQEPRVLLLDEPTAHLDIAHQAGIMDLVKRLNKELGLTVIIILHDLNLASEYCQKLLLINEGRIHKIGQPDKVLDYQTIEEVYKTIVVVEKNPLSSKPYVLLVSEEERQRGGREARNIH